ncbi:hypothetical protein HHK36_031631 [Tetracentron sinense]|uniref:Actin-related protein 5 n=1 Tax=Tetracentron sinense TaxID=13715 RepID=A0A834YA07_TETSI|nr:hypothetical protein HHK36_031631 [Tetracentron sinense]
MRLGLRRPKLLVLLPPFRLGVEDEPEFLVLLPTLSETVTIVGDHDPALMKYFDCTRSSHRSAFDGNVVYQFEIMEYILDYGFERMGADGSQVDHPILITECVCNPVQSRSKLAELLFEGYGVPSVAFGVDAVFSYKYNQQLGVCDKDGLAICSGLNTSHIIPVSLSTLIYLKLVMDIISRFSSRMSGAKEAEEKNRCWQLPWIPPPAEEPPSEEEIARKAAIKEKQGQRLREMAAAKRSSRIMNWKMNCKTGYISKLEIESAVVRVTQSLKKAKREQVEIEEKMDPSMTEKYTLINIPDNMLSPEQLKEKRKQLFIKTTSEGRQRAKQKRFEEELDRERQNELDEKKRLENPELYLEQLHAKHRELSEKFEQRKRLKVNGTHTNESHNSSGGVGCGERLNAAQKERMRLLTTAAFEGRFPYFVSPPLGSSPWQDIDPTFVAKSEIGPFPTIVEIPRFRPLTKEDFQIILGVERFRCPEILFQPNMIGIDQAGMDEMAGISIRRLPLKGNSVEERITNSILMTGGSCLFPGMGERLEAGIRKIRPFESPIRVVRASDPVLDAWRGAAAVPFSEQTFSRQDYYEKGEDWLRRYNLRYTF